jgi:hypothetical protein
MQAGEVPRRAAAPARGARLLTTDSESRPARPARVS